MMRHLLQKDVAQLVMLGKLDHPEHLLRERMPEAKNRMAGLRHIGPAALEEGINTNFCLRQHTDITAAWQLQLLVDMDTWQPTM